MNKELTQRIEDLLHALSLKYHTKEDSIPQIASYHNEDDLNGIKLVELLPEVTVAAHQRANHAHILLLDKSIQELKKDFEGVRQIIPLVIFTIKYGKTPYVGIKPGRLDQIKISSMGKDCFDIFITLQALVYKP